MGASTGGLLLASTVTARLCVALSGGRPSSVTTTSNALVPTWSWVGAHVKTPLVGLMVALVAAPGPRLNVST